MTDILAEIDDTLADWHGSADAMRWRPEPDHTVVVVPVGESGYRDVLGHIGHGFTADGQWACGLAPSQGRGDEVPDSGPFWQVANAHGRWVLARGHTEAEAIDNARSIFASNVIYVGPGLPAAPDPAFAQVGMRAFLLQATPRCS